MMKLSLKGVPELLERLKVPFDIEKNWEDVFIHSSYSHENKLDKNYEKLEFVGDSVLNLCITKLLYDIKKDFCEGKMSRTRAYFISSKTLLRLGTELGLEKLIFMGRGQRLDNKGKEKIIVDVFESVIGNIYLNYGYTKVFSVIEKIYKKEIDQFQFENSVDPKTGVQEKIHILYKKHPTYKSEEISINGIKKIKSVLWVGDKKIAEDIGNFKWEAERQVAEKAYKLISKEK